MLVMETFFLGLGVAFAGLVVMVVAMVATGGIKVYRG